MKIEEMLRSQQGRVSFHMPGHKMRIGEASTWDVTELDGTDDLHHPHGAYVELAHLLAQACGAAVSLPLVGGSTRGVQLMILSALEPGDSLILMRNAHLSAWSACALGGIRPISVLPSLDEENQLPYIPKECMIQAMDQNPEARAVLLTRPDYYGRMEDLRDVIRAAHNRKMLVLVDEAHGAHLPYTNLESAGELGADLWVQSLHKTLPALTPCAVVHAANAQWEPELRRRHHMLETSSPSSLLLYTMERCVLYMKENGAQALKVLTQRCTALREALSSDARFCRTKDLYQKYSIDPARLVIDVRGTGLTGYEVSAFLAEQGVDMEMADYDRVVGIPSVLTTQEDLDALYTALCALPYGTTPAQSCILPQEGQRVCSVRQASMSHARWLPLDQAAGGIVVESVGIYPPGVPLCVAGECLEEKLCHLLLEAQKKGASLFGVNERGEIAIVNKNYDCVIFDLDGTLMDTSEGVMKSVQYALRGMGYPDDDLERIRRFIGPPLHAAFRELYNMTDEQAKEAVRLYRVRYESTGVLEYTPFPGMCELVRDLKAKGKRIAVATGKPEKFSRIILEREGLMSCIDMLVTPKLTDTHDSKPKMVRSVLEKLGSNALMVGDRCFDMQGARANGIEAAGVLQGFGSREELEASGATYIVKGAQELRALLL